MADYVTVVEVDDPTSQDPQLLLRKSPPQTPTDDDPSFITVLSINNNNLHNSSNSSSVDPNPKEIETVVVYRLPGERLGFGLKFQGGTRSTEKVQKLFIQSCAKDSPASKVITSWGHLREGDEIVKIDEMYVREMTRIECVKGLKDNVAIKLEVRNGRGLKPDDIEDEYESHLSKHLSTFKGGLSHTAQMKGTPPPPPPVPPRKLIKKSSQAEKNSLPDHSVDAHNSNITELDGLVGAQDKSFTPPPDAEFYINLFAENGSTHTNGNHLLRPYNGESESDDTASTISTVIDRYSMTSNYSSESDLSGFNSLNQSHQVVINKPELAKVLKPFTLLEQEFQLNSSAEETLTNVLESSLDVDMQPITLIPGNNYENIEFKTLKVNVYENMELKPKEDDNKEEVKTPTEEEFKQVTPTPKPRQVTAHIEPKKRSIIPMPRKLTPSIKQAIEVKPPTVPETATATTPASSTKPTTPNTPTNVDNPSAALNFTASNAKTLTKEGQSFDTTNPTTPTTPTTPTNVNTHNDAALNTMPNTPSNSKPLVKESTSLGLTNAAKEFTTKIPKAIGSSPLNSPSQMERSKTESEIKLKPLAGKLEKLKIKTSEFLDHEAHKLNRITPGSPLKSRIPIHLSNKRNVELDCVAVAKTSKSPTNIPRRLTKQKSETDLNLNYLINTTPSKESSPINQNKLPLQRTFSAEAKFKSPERCLIPVLQQPVTPSNLNSSNESLSSNNSITKNRGPKPKPPERVQSLPKTNIPKLTVNNVTTVAVAMDRSNTPSSPPASNMPSMQTFKQMSPKPLEKPVTGHLPSPVSNREVLFKIQTYESKAPSKEPIINVFHDQEQQMPSLFELQRRSTPPTERRNTNDTLSGGSSSSSKESSPLNKIRNLFNEMEANEPEDLERTTPPPLVVGKCKKVEDTTAPLYYSSSSSSSDEEEDNVERSHSFSTDEDKDYVCEDGEKLGPPELINGPGPSEAYFNLYWHSNMLPTIGEVEEECSSLEPQSLTNG